MRGILHSNLTHNIARFQAHQRRIAPKHPVLTHQRHVNVTTASSSGSTSPPSSPDEQASVNPPKSSSNAPSPEPSHPSNANNNGSNHKAQNRLQRLLSKRGRWPSLEDANLPLWIKLVFKAGALVKQQLVALILLHGCIDVVTFLLHRVSHRMTNAVAVQLLPAVTAGKQSVLSTTFVVARQLLHEVCVHNSAHVDIADDGGWTSLYMMCVHHQNLPPPPHHHRVYWQPLLVVQQP